MLADSAGGGALPARPLSLISEGSGFSSPRLSDAGIEEGGERVFPGCLLP